MEYITDLSMAQVEGESIITIGKFDGLHLGHQQLFRRLERLKEERNCKTIAFTFNMSLLYWKYGKDFKFVLETEERNHHFEALGVDMVIECPFTEAFRSMEAEAFVKDILVDKLHANCIVIGKDYRFGHERKGNFELLKALSAKYGFEVQLIDEVYQEGSTERTSSSAIRAALAVGDMEKANSMLGYAYTVEGVIMDGQHLGRTIDMPTINLIPSENKLLPPFGVYTSITEMDGKLYPGVTNIGKKPTVGEFAVGVETHLLDVKGDFYGKYAKVHLYHYQRPEQRFGSIDELKNQMHQDRVNARAIIATME